MKALITLTLSLFLFLSCQEKQFKRDLVLDHNQVGDRYRVIWHLYAASDTIWTLGGIANSRSSKEGFDRFNEGDIFEITEIKRVSYSSWNEGDYSYLVLKLKLLTGERRGEVFSANNIIDSAEIGVDLGLPVLEKVSLKDEPEEGYQATQLTPDQREKLEFLLEAYAKARIYHASRSEYNPPSDLRYKERTPEEEKLLRAFRSRTWHIRDKYEPLIWDIYQEKYLEIIDSKSSDLETFKGEVTQQLEGIINSIDEGLHIDPLEYMRKLESGDPAYGGPPSSD